MYFPVQRDDDDVDFPRVIRWFGLEGTLKSILFHPLPWARPLLPAQAAQNPIQTGLGHCLSEQSVLP